MWPGGRRGDLVQVREGVTHQLSIRSDIELLHHGIFVKGDRAWSYVESQSNLFHREAFGKEFEDLPLSGG